MLIHMDYRILTLEHTTVLLDSEDAKNVMNVTLRCGYSDIGVL
jgi:hypothetical protein